jgi:hypothetical protein
MRLQYLVFDTASEPVVGALHSSPHLLRGCVACHRGVVAEVSNLVS